MSAASTSFSKKSYDVFINHRGADVKRKLAGSLYQTLNLMGMRVFLDLEELELGDSFPQVIEEALRSASLYIAIFSPRYAESPWCLEELSMMLQMNVTIIPVFYSVDPSHLRHVARGIYADAFHRHQRSSRYEPEKIKEWQEALGRVSYLSGIVVDNKEDEGKLLRKIVDSVLYKLKKVPLALNTYDVGLEEAVHDFETEVGSSTKNNNVQIVGIVGLGGAGKTTLAKELYKRKLSSFSRSSFLSNVRYAASTNTLNELQRNLLQDLHIQHSAFHSIQQGMEILAKELRSLTVLIVLDDVDNVDQLDALLPQNLGTGSFIIVTTRKVDILLSWGISCIYHMKLLNPVYARQLFCRHAFSNSMSKFEDNHFFEDLIESFVRASNGLPLSLKIFGAMVNGRSKAYWENQLLKISRILPKEICQSLKLTYDALDSEERQMFLDVACFFIGEHKSLVVAIWDGSEWKGELGWQTLVNRSLVELDENGRIYMHNHLRDLGREIARDVSPARIWKEEHISIQGERHQIRGIVAAATVPPWLSWPPLQLSISWYPLHLETIIQKQRWPVLQLLALRGNYLREEFASLSRGLVWLRWFDFDGIKLPAWLSLANLRVLELCNANNLEELWEDNVQLPLQLRELIIYLTRTCFRGFPKAIGRLWHLKKIVLHGCGSEMMSLPEEFCRLESLEFLELSGFPVLSSLPDDFGVLRNLRSLQLSAVQLTMLPHSFIQLTALRSLEISDSKSFMFTLEMFHVLEFMTQLQILRFKNCPQLEELPRLTTLVSLRELDLRCTGLRELPNHIGQLTKLETLAVGSPNLTSLPVSLGELSCLISLVIEGCEMLKSLPEAFGRLSNLRSLTIVRTPLLELGLGMGSPSGCNLRSLKYLSLFKTRVSRITISDDCCPSLETLRLLYNKDLTEIETLPKNVREIRVDRCQKLKNMRSIGGLLNLEMLQVEDCPDLEVLPCPTHGCEITIRGCPKVESM